MSKSLTDKFVSPSDPSPRHLPALDGLRGLAALAVVLGHLPEFGFANCIADQSKDYGVVLFFSLSGFLMGHLYLRRGWTLKSAWTFATARIARIVPIYFMVVLSSYLIYKSFLPNFVYDVSALQLLRLLTFNGSVSTFWSVGPEFQFYAVFVALWWAWDQRAIRPFAIAAAAAICLIGIIFNPQLPGIIFLSKAHIFLFGTAASIVLRRLWDRAGLSWARLILQACSLLSLIAIAVPNPWIKQVNQTLAHSGDVKMASFYGNPFVAVWMALIVFSLAWGGRATDMLFSNRLLIFLGEVSFSLYLLHDAVLWTLEKGGLVSWLGSPAASALALLLCLALASASYRLLELPSRSFVRNWLSGVRQRRTRLI